MTRIQEHRRAPAPSVHKTGLLLGFLLALLVVSVALAAGNIDATNKWAWSTNAGWINFNPDNGGVTVFSDHLEGYAWGENIGWIRLGTCTGGSPCTHANTAADNYGVNNDGVGNLSGYAWGTNVGWINFKPANGGVTVDPATGDFNGYAWGENVGWIHFQNGSPAYKVATGWRGDPPVAVADLQASESGTNVALTWSDVGSSADHYEVWRSSAPYFAPIPAEGSLIAPNVPHTGDPISFTDETSHLGNPDINDYYVVLAVSAGGQKSLVSNRVGAFDFGLQPGAGP